MYHRPALDSPESQVEHAHRLQQYQAMPADEALRRAERTIGSDLCWNRTAQHGVIHIERIPHSATRNEIMQLCGRKAPYIPMHEFPVHITMERTTGRTHDCYVEFQTEKDAREVLLRIRKISDSGFGPRMGRSTLDITLSSPNALLKAIFPKAKDIEWVNGWPRAGSSRGQGSSARCDGFLSEEELTSLVRFANEAERSNFAGRVLQRPYESIMSAISKFPWSATDMYTVHERNMLFQTLIQMIRALVKRLDEGIALGLDSHLINELVQIGLRCPGFSPRMKFRVAEAGRDTATLQRMSKEYLAYFPFETLTWLKPFDATALAFCASMIARGTAEWNDEEGLTNIHGSQWPVPYGHYFFLWDESKAKVMKFSEAIHYEMRIFRSLITSGYTNSRLSQTASHQPSLVSGARPCTQPPIPRPASATNSLSLSIRSPSQVSCSLSRAPASPSSPATLYPDPNCKARVTSDGDSGSSSAESPNGGTRLP